jgi:YHS domain-containing protein
MAAALPATRTARFRELAAMTVDPVCGMAVDRDGGPHVEHDGEVVWFCRRQCRDEFVADPGRFLPAGPGPWVSAAENRDRPGWRRH